MTSLFPPFNRRSSFRKQPYFYEAGRGVNYKSTGGPFPTLDLNFLSGTLDPRITFSRASNATLTDSTGKITFAPNNLLTYSDTPSNAAWSRSNTTVLGNVVTLTGAPGAFQYIQQSVSPAPSTGDTYIWAVQMSGTGTITLDGNAFSGSQTCTLSATPTWFFVRLVFTSGAASVRIISYGGNTATSFTLHNSSVARVTYETSPRTQDQVTTVASAYYGPRFDYDPVTLAAKGLLIEEARTNLALQSQTLDSATWTKNGSSITANATTAPDGTLTADLWIPTTSGFTSTTRLLQSMTVANATVYTATVYVKAFGRRWVYFSAPDASANSYNCWFDLQNGVVGTKGANVTSATITNVGSGWYRLSVTSTSTSTTNYVFMSSTDADNSTTVTANSVDGLYVWGAQVEAGAFATSYIPTVASSVARSADIATMTGTNFSSWFNQGPVNLLLQSQTFDNAGWTKQNTTVSADAIAAPNGTTTADQIVETATTSAHNILQLSTYAVGANTFSVYAKKGTRQWVVLQFTDTFGNNLAQYYDLDNIAVGTVTNSGSRFTKLSASIEDVGNGWRRIVLSVSALASGGANSNSVIGLASANGTNSYAGTISDSGYFWGAQLEVGSTATTYIPTTTAPAASPPAVGTLIEDAYWNSAFTTSYIYYTTFTMDATTNNIISLTTNSLASAYRVRFGAVDQVDITISPAVLLTNIRAKRAMAFETNNFATAVNGGNVSVDTVGSVPAVILLNFNLFNGGSRTIASIKYYPTRLTNAKLQALTV